MARRERHRDARVYATAHTRMHSIANESSKGLSQIRASVQLEPFLMLDPSTESRPSRCISYHAGASLGRKASSSRLPQLVKIAAATTATSFVLGMPKGMSCAMMHARGIKLEAT